MSMNTKKIPVIGSSENLRRRLTQIAAGYVAERSDVVKVLAEMTLSGRLEQQVIDRIGEYASDNVMVEVIFTKTISGRTVHRLVFALPGWTEAVILVGVCERDGVGELLGLSQTFSRSSDAAPYHDDLITLCGGAASLKLAA